MTAFVCYTGRALAHEIGNGAGAIVLTDATVAMEDFGAVLTTLAQQPSWSDLPVVLLCKAGMQSPLVTSVVGSFTNVTILDRPTSPRTLVSTVQAAIRNRLRQYQIRDQLTALREAQEALRQRERELHLAHRRKDEFLAMLAHEMRNPLAPIRNASEILARMLPDDPRLKSTVGMVKRQVVHLSRLVDDLLDVSRITQGRVELHMEPLDLASVVTHALESVEPLMKEKRHKLFVSTGYESLYVLGDSARLVQCVSNVLTNAAKYTDEGGEIRVELRSEPSHAVISVTDNGIGIPPDMIPHLFELFVQSERSLERSQGGLGIGLSVVQRLVEMHGGTVTAHSEGPGTGATFEIRLPLTHAPEKTAPRTEVCARACRRILIVDDNKDAANSLASVLQLEGHTVRPVYGPEEALEEIPDFDPDVILLDIGLPRIDGYELAKRVRACGCRARLVALTGYGQWQDVRKGREAGFQAHLVKPVDIEVLTRELA